MTNILKIHPKDNVAVAIQPLGKGCKIEVDEKVVLVLENIPAGHKIALRDIEEGEDIIKYGFPIGHATETKMAGSWMNEKNIRTNLSGKLEYEYNKKETIPSPGERQMPRTFMGYKRKDGQVGIRNEVWIIPTVGCVNGIANRLADKLRQETGADNIHAFTHNYGCSQLGEDHENTKRILRCMVHHPNAGAILVVGLGCENNQPDVFEQFCGNYDKERVRFVVTQKIKGDETDYCMSVLRELYAKTQNDKRTECPLSELRVGLKCGGSDGFSGITANPLLGVYSDYLVAQGGTTVLTEVPEMFGSETLLMDRCINRAVFDKTVRLINDFKEYFLSHGEPVGENPSPGNKAGGISTLEEKAIGCTQKCGSSAVQDVLSYGDRLQEKGLNLLSAPGNDLVASTALAAAGCHIILFTTGRGTPFGTFVPTMKISTNSQLFQDKPHWIDFNAGGIVEGEQMEYVSKRFSEFILEVANGQETNNERNGYREISIFKNGVTL